MGALLSITSQRDEKQPETLRRILVWLLLLLILAPPLIALLLFNNL